ESVRLTGCDWDGEQKAEREALTQAIARATFERMAEGLVVPSAQAPGGVNVVYFPCHRREESTLITYGEEDIPHMHGL
ncbi:MAG: RES domain-containing protein, partial [Chitinophagaceae bacterium]